MRACAPAAPGHRPHTLTRHPRRSAPRPSSSCSRPTRRRRGPHAAVDGVRHQAGRRRLPAAPLDELLRAPLRPKALHERLLDALTAACGAGVCPASPPPRDADAGTRSVTPASASASSRCSGSSSPSPRRCCRCRRARRCRRRSSSSSAAAPPSCATPRSPPPPSRSRPPSAATAATRRSGRRRRAARRRSAAAVGQPAQAVGGGDDAAGSTPSSRARRPPTTRTSSVDALARRRRRAPRAADGDAADPRIGAGLGGRLVAQGRRGGGTDSFKNGGGLRSASATSRGSG